jgi:hypothetical protein
MGLFSRTLAEVKSARSAYARGDRVHQCGLQLRADTNPNVVLNQIAAEGWEPAGFTVVLDNGVPYAVYLFRRSDPTG